MNIAVFPLPVCDGHHHRTGAVTMSGTDLSHVWDKARFMQFIRARFPQSPEYHLATLAGVPVGTCRKHIYGETKPSADHVLQYLAIFGPALLIAVMGDAAPEWVRRGQHEERRHQLQHQAAAIATELAEYSA